MPYYNLNYKFSLRQALAACHGLRGTDTGTHDPSALQPPFLRPPRRLLPELDAATPNPKAEEPHTGPREEEEAARPRPLRAALTERRCSVADRRPDVPKIPSTPELTKLR